MNRDELQNFFVEKKYGNVFKLSMVDPDNWCSDNFIEVKAIDFSDWLVKNVARDDYVVCKMDVESAEFDVLEHLLRTKID